jgi:hypothetical protein
LLGGVFNDNRQLGCPLAGDVARINIRCHTSKRRRHANVKIHSKKNKKQQQVGGSAEDKL